MKIHVVMELMVLELLLVLVEMFQILLLEIRLWLQDQLMDVQLVNKLLFLKIMLQKYQPPSL